MNDEVPVRRRPHRKATEIAIADERRRGTLTPEREQELQDATSVVRLISKARNQDDVPEGKLRYWCRACLDLFIASKATGEPLHCPSGHGVYGAGANA